MNRLLTWHRYEALKSQAADLIEDYALEYPVDPFRLASTLGLRVHTIELGSAFYTAACPYVEALATATSTVGSVRYDVYLDPLNVDCRQRFSLMHEISHIWLGHLDVSVAGDRQILEGEANFLAQYLLAPDALVGHWLPTLTSQAVHETFNVSWQTADLVVKRFQRAISKHGVDQEYDIRILSNARRAVHLETRSTGGAA